MFLAEKTVKNYVSALFAKLGMERRTQAAAYAVRVFGDHRTPATANRTGGPRVPATRDLMPLVGRSAARHPSGHVLRRLRADATAQG